MQNIIGKILFIIVVTIAALFIYKTIKISSTKPISVTITENKSSEGTCEKEKVKEIIKEYLISSPEIIIQSIEGLQKRKIMEKEDKVNSYIKNNQVDIETSKTFPTLGNINGDITIVTFFDYNCSYCKKGDLFINQLLESDSNVKLLLRPLPILGDASQYLAQVALAVYKVNPDKFKAIHEGLMAIKDVTKKSVENLLVENDLNISEIEEIADSKEVKALIEEDMEIAKNLKIQGVPVFIINGRLIPGLIDLVQLQSIVKDIRANK
ncbi:DsbA family protein [Rickettsia endosymbiont of Halotydeus destructor]|uniref:DsbA family protein n=1 Tax=Rickettsia endosymbiont of Halotydeus destructor TaxID=2996754 RepID=UPI003BB10520